MEEAGAGAGGGAEEMGEREARRKRDEARRGTVGRWGWSGNSCEEGLQGLGYGGGGRSRGRKRKRRGGSI